jgi:hypothetical protein
VQPAGDSRQQPLVAEAWNPQGTGPGLSRLDDEGLGGRFLGGPLFSADGKLQGILVAGPGGTKGALSAAVVRKALEADLHASADAP